VSTHSPFGEPEPATGRWLPYLRFATSVVLTAAAVSVSAAGAAGAQLPDGTLDIVRNLPGIAGIGLLTATITGGTLAWIGPSPTWSSPNTRSSTRYHYPGASCRP
jgi:hypothetical protein